MTSLYEQCKEAECKMDHHYSDLYVEVSITARKLLKKNKTKYVTTFIHQLYQTLWYG